MKRNIFISFIALATLLIQAFAMLPHHHHEGVACIITEHCKHDATTGDGHSHHSNIPEGSTHGESCIVESDYIASDVLRESKCKVSCDSPGHTHFYPVLFLVADLLSGSADAVDVKPECRDCISFYTSAEASRFHGLRAPPHFLS